MDLQTLIDELSKRDPNMVVTHGFGCGHSDRGDYSNAAFTPCEETTIGEMLRHARELLDSEQEGYKGGMYVMHKYVTVHIGKWGYCGEAITRHHFLYWDAIGR